MRKALYSLVCFALATSNMLFSTQPPMAADEPKGLLLRPGKELVLTLKHKGHGDFLIILSAQGIHVISTGNGGETIAAAPDWKVVCFQRKSKIQWSSTMESFSSHSLNPLEFPAPTALDQRHISRYAPATTLCGLDCVKDVGQDAIRPLTIW
jgi:hypothetical protein